MKIDGEYLSHLRFPVDILICANTPHELQQMIQELTDNSKNQDLKMNMSMTKVMMEHVTPTYVNNNQIENGQIYSTRDKKPRQEIQRRITAGLTAFAKHRDIFKGNIGTCLKKQIYSSCLLPAMRYGVEAWVLTIRAKNKLAAVQRKMDWSILNIIYRDRKNKHLDKRKIFLQN